MNDDTREVLLNNVTPKAVTELVEEATAQARYLAEDLAKRAQIFAADAMEISKLSGLSPGVQTPPPAWHWRWQESH